MCAEQLRQGGQLKGIKRGYVVRGDDSTARAPCPNENWLPDRGVEDTTSRNSLQMRSNLSVKKPLPEPRLP